MVRSGKIGSNKTVESDELRVVIEAADEADDWADNDVVDSNGGQREVDHDKNPPREHVTR